MDGGDRADVSSEMMAAPRPLLIGHGYLGSALAARLDQSGFAVTAVSRFAEAGSTYPVLSGDVSSRDSLRVIASALAAGKPDVIIHCASSSRGGPEAYRSVFVEGLRNLHEVFPGVPVLFTSSSSVYGQVDGSVVTEESETRPDRETSHLLCEAEAIARDAGGIVLRLAGIYGPGRSVHLKKMLEGSATIEEGGVSRFLNQIHRHDAVAAIEHLLAGGVENFRGRTFNLADDIPLTQRECYEGLAAFFHLPLPPTAPPATHRKRAWTHKIVSNAALRATGWRPLYPSFLDAVRKDDTLVPSIRALLEAEADLSSPASTPSP